ncbi:MAG: glucuronate isomerase [Spirochaetota bacterium]
MKKYMDNKFLLTNRKAEQLYNEFARDMPIFNYHSHLPVEEIASNRCFSTITELWLEHDHYKWRAMRWCGIEERFITGDAPDFEKFKAWAECMPFLLRNPLYHWCHMELREFFGIDDVILGPETAKDVYDRCNSVLQKGDLDVRTILKIMKVDTLYTTNDPVEELSYHKMLRNENSLNINIFPALRPDNALCIEDPELFNGWIRELGRTTDMDIDTFDDLIGGIEKSYENFHKAGCRASDHGIEVTYAQVPTLQKVRKLFSAARKGVKLKGKEIVQYKAFLMKIFAELNTRKGWVMQLHLGAKRNNNSLYFSKLGADSGFDSIGENHTGDQLVAYLDQLSIERQVPKMVIFNSNPRDNELLVSIIGSFQAGEKPGRIQFGPAWWFNDTEEGIIKQLEALSGLGVLGKFIGMVTDSRSFLSFVRHDYFRRILCNLLGSEMEKGTIPDDIELVGKTVQNICYNNARKFFTEE